LIVADCEDGQAHRLSRPPIVKVTISFVNVVSGGIPFVACPEVICPTDVIQLSVNGLSCEPPLIVAEAETVSPADIVRSVTLTWISGQLRQSQMHIALIILMVSDRDSATTFPFRFALTRIQYELGAVLDKYHVIVVP
jgi:hypothetical protein